jgi:hypothetical protein
MNKPYSNVLVALLKGILYSDKIELWDALLKPENEADIKNYFADIYLDVIIDKSEGYAYLKQKTNDDDENEIPKIIEKRQLNFHVSLLCLLLRKHLIENDRDGESLIARLSKEDILNLVKPFYKVTSNEEKQIKPIEAAIKRLEDEGFLRRLKNDDEQYEINRILKAFVNADTVKDSLEKLRIYSNQNIE